MQHTVIAVAEWRLSHWNEEEYKFDNLLVWTRLVYAVVLCLSRMVNNDSISGPQLASIGSAAHSALSCFERLLVQQEWSRLRPEEEQLEDGRGDVWPGIFPHRLSNLFVIWVIQPLAHILTNTQLRPAMPHSLVHALQGAWLAVQQAYPSPLDLVVLDRIPMDTGVRTIVLALDNLCKLLQDTNAPGGSTMTTVRPRITSSPHSTNNVISAASESGSRTHEPVCRSILMPAMLMTPLATFLPSTYTSCSGLCHQAIAVRESVVPLPLRQNFACINLECCCLTES